MGNPASAKTVDFLAYLGAEENHFLATFASFRHEFDVFIHLDGLYLKAISHAKATHDDDVIVLQLLLFVHYHYYHSAATLLRCHLSEALSSLRAAIDAGLTAYRIIEDRPSQMQYIQRDKSFQYPKSFFQKAHKKNPNTFPLAAPLLNRRDACSRYGSHADIESFAHRLELPKEPGQMLRLHYFQRPKNQREFAWYYLLLMHTFLIILQVFDKFLVQEKRYVTSEWSNSIPQLGKYLEKLMEDAREEIPAADQ